MFQPLSPFIGKSELLPNPVSQPTNQCFSGSPFSVNFTAPNRKSPRVNFVVKSLDHASKLEAINKFTTFL